MKKLLNLFYGLPVVLFFFSTIMNLAATATGDPIFGTSLLDSEMLMFGTMMSPIFVYFTFSILGIVLILSNNAQAKMIGKGLYSVSMVSSFLIYRAAGIDLGFISQNDAAPANNMAFGGTLLIVSAIIGIVIVLLFIFVPIIKDLLNKFYGDKSSNNSLPHQGKDAHPFEDLRQWKTLFDENVVSEEEYVNIKKETLDNMKFKKASKIETINLLKDIEGEGLITSEDFANMKKELL